MTLHMIPLMVSSLPAINLVQSISANWVVAICCIGEALTRASDNIWIAVPFQHFRTESMKRSGCAIKIMLLLTFLCQGRALADDYMLKLAERYYKAGDYQNAANSWESALVSSPNSAYAHYMRANALVKLNQISEAKAEYARAGALDLNGSIGAYSNQGLANLTQR